MRVDTHMRTPQSHCGKTPLMSETIQKYGKQARTMERHRKSVKLRIKESERRGRASQIK